MATLHLVRHGETTSNVMRRLDTALPGAALTDFGIRQAARFALEHGDVGEVRLLCSPAARARQTAEVIGDVWGVTPEVVQGVYEVQLGDLEGRTDDDAHELFVKIVRSWYGSDEATGRAGERLRGVAGGDDPIPGGESWSMVRDRFMPVIDDIAARYLDGADARDVYLVSHGAAIRLIAAHLGQVEPRFALEHHLRNCSEVELNYALGQWDCVRWGDDEAPFTSTDPSETVIDPMG
ncbi:histidine phosphatase family protein [Gordonia jinhuaensis]|uniref:Phosphoglycerate mutase n=1 Tax=Gordonia jinhuaensis TaxID=1517702 RepID=A0A916WYW7_9ACTN|nr:histidine phosphatase family protein [Gordonia jinhuaensis]GGB43177.1 putative phosphoglycerate mutase [Gordonia jinhuaensis]